MCCLCAKYRTITFSLLIRPCLHHQLLSILIYHQLSHTECFTCVIYIYNQVLQSVINIPVVGVPLVEAGYRKGKIANQSTKGAHGIDTLHACTRAGMQLVWSFAKRTLICCATVLIRIITSVVVIEQVAVPHSIADS